MLDYVDCHDLKQGIFYRFCVNYNNLCHPTYKGATHFIILQNVFKQSDRFKRVKVKAAIFCKYQFIGVSDFFVYDSEIMEEKSIDFDFLLSEMKTKIEHLQHAFESLKKNQAA